MPSDESLQNETTPGAETEEETTPVSTPIDKRAVMRVETGEADVRMSAVGYLAADSAEVKMSPTAFTYARESAELKLSSANLLAAGNDVHLQYSGGQVVAAKNDVRLEMAAAGAVLSREAHVDRGLVGLLIASDVELGEGTRVLLRPAGAAALGAGFAGGVFLAIALLWKLFSSVLKKRGDD